MVAEDITALSERRATSVDIEAGWIARARAGDGAAFERLYRRHVDRVYGLCMRLTNGNVRQAEQHTQDAFVRAWEKLDSFRGTARFGTWLHRLTVNVVLGEKRQLKRWTSLEDTDLEPASVRDQAGLRMDLEQAVARLPAGARTVLILHDVEGYKHSEIAEMTGIASGTSKAQLHRARKLVNEWMIDD